MENLFNSEEYQKRRKEREQYFVEENLIKTDKLIIWNDYTLEVSYYKTKKGYSDFTRGIVKKNNEIIADVKRNYNYFIYCFAERENGEKYMLCGEDYQGYTVINLLEKTTNTYIPSAWEFGGGFCWIDIDYYDDELRVEGCVWGGPFEIIRYDFSDPNKLPLTILERYDDED